MRPPLPGRSAYYLPGPIIPPIPGDVHTIVHDCMDGRVIYRWQDPPKRSHHRQPKVQGPILPKGPNWPWNDMRLFPIWSCPCHGLKDVHTVRGKVGQWPFRHCIVGGCWECEP